MTVYKRGSTWRADVSTSRKGEKPARISRSFDTKVEAENFEKNTRQQIESARASGMQLPDSTTLRDALTEWWEDAGPKFAESGRESALIWMRKWQSSHLGELPVSELSRKHLKGWIAERQAAGRAASTLRNDLNILMSLFKFLQDDLDWQINNPVAPLLRRLRIDNKRDRRLSKDEYQRLIATFRLMAEAYNGRDRTRESYPDYRGKFNRHSHRQSPVTLMRGHRLVCVGGLRILVST